MLARRRCGSSTGGSGAGGELTDWPSFYGQIITVTGWTYPQVDALYVWQAYELSVYWSKHPPVHILLRAIAGLEPATTNNQTGKFDSLDSLPYAVASVGGHGLPIDALPQYLKDAKWPTN